jgi:hypothetical protein
MANLEQMAKEQDQMLRELAELGMSFARKLEAKVELVTSVDEAQALALAFHRIQRGVRLTLALRAKLVRDHLEIGKLERSAAQRATERRKAQVTAVLDREIFTDEADQDTADHLAERLTERLDAEALFDDFLNGPLDHVIARIRKDLGLPEEHHAPGSSPVETGEGDHPPESGWGRGQGFCSACGSPPPPPALRPAVPLPRCAGEEKKPAPS